MKLKDFKKFQKNFRSLKAGFHRSFIRFFKIPKPKRSLKAIVIKEMLFALSDEICLCQHSAAWNNVDLVV